MRICHLADSHLGAGENFGRRGKSGLTIRQEDIIDSFIEAIDKIIELAPDVCVHSGDIFHKVRPSNSILAVAANQLHRLAEVHAIPTVIITGNHDAPKQPHFGAGLEIFRQIENLYIAANSELEIFEILGSKFYALPHCLTTDSLKMELAKCQPDSQVDFNILLLHGVAAGMPEFSMVDLGEQELPLNVIERFDYCALGHYHNYCQVAPKAWYAGSTERLSQSERDSEKGFLEIEFNPYNVKFYPVKTRGMVDIVDIDAGGKRGDQLLEIISKKIAEIKPSEKIVRVNVKGVTSETLSTLPRATLAELKEKAFDLDIRFEKKATEDGATGFDKSTIGRLDQEFAKFIDNSDISGFDRERLLREALKYLQSDE